MTLFWGTPLAMVIAFLWYGPVIRTHGWTFIDEFFVQHHFARFVSNKYHHPQPIYFYPAILLLLTLPWTPFLITALLKVKSWDWRASDGLNTVRIFALAWLVMPVLFFSFSGSKLPGYILPVLPAAALLAAELVTRACNFSEARWSVRATGLVCLVLGIAALVFASRSSAFPIVCVLVISGVLVLAAVSTFVFERTRAISVSAIATATFVLVIAASNCAAPIAQRESVRDLLKLADERGYPNTPVLAQRGDDRSAEFYASNRVIYRPDGEPLTIDEITLPEARRVGRMLVFIPVQHAEPLHRTPGMEYIGTNGRLSLFGWIPQ